MSLINTYTSLTDVRRVLRAPTSAGRIRFSEAYNWLKRSNDSSGTVDLAAIGISNEYADVANYSIEFSDETSFTMYKVDSQNLSNLILGSGVIQNDFTSSDGNFEIDSTNWTGTVVSGDTIDFKTNSHISINDGTRFIQDAEKFVDSILEENIVFENSLESTLLFDQTSVPKAVQFAACRIAAYLIYKSVYLEQNSEKTGDNIAVGWLNEGLSILSSYVKKYNLQQTSAPIIGNVGENTPLDLENGSFFQSSVFNLSIPLMNISNSAIQEAKAYNYIGSADYQNSIIADIQFFDTPSE